MSRYPVPLQQLIQLLKRLPGVGQKSAERYAFHLLEMEEGDLEVMGEVIASIRGRVCNCSICGALLMPGANCTYCDLHERNPDVLCVVAHFKDVFALEETGEYQGLYHVLGGVLSPLEGKGPEELRIESLLRRLSEGKIREMIIALDSTLEGDATALYLKNAISHLPLKVSRLAFGIPLGSSLDYVDGGTLARSLLGRSFYG